MQHFNVSGWRLDDIVVRICGVHLQGFACATRQYFMAFESVCVCARVEKVVPFKMTMLVRALKSFRLAIDSSASGEQKLSLVYHKNFVLVVQTTSTAINIVECRPRETKRRTFFPASSSNRLKQATESAKVLHK